MAMKISFVTQDRPMYFLALKAGRKTLEAQSFDGALTVSVQYDYHRQPLSLHSPVAPGDKVEVVLLAHRIELYVNQILMDEEWPAGKQLFELGDPISFDDAVTVEPYVPQEPVLPDVLSEFENAEGWYPGNGVYVGDCMPYRKADEYHVLYLKDRHHHHSKWMLGAHQWEHISTRDFKTWRIHPMAVPITDPSEGSICTGSWISNGRKEYLFYATRRCGGKPATINRSISDDGYHFTKDTDFGFTISDKYKATVARDPKIVADDRGVFHMFLTTTLLQQNRGCLAHYISRDLDTWEECDAPIYIAPGTDEPECPDYFAYQGRYYLIFSLRGKGHYMVSDKPFTDFAMPEDPIIPGVGVPKGAIWGDKLIFTGFKKHGTYAGEMCFTSAKAAEDGTLVFEGNFRK